MCYCFLISSLGKARAWKNNVGWGVRIRMPTSVNAHILKTTLSEEATATQSSFYLSSLYSGKMEDDSYTGYES